MKTLMPVLLIVVALLVAAPLAAQEEARVVVNPQAVVGEISPYVFGSNMNLYAVIPQSLMDEARALGLRFMRFGGGDTDIQDLRTTIIDLFVLQSRAIGAEPALSVRLLGGTPEKAADIVRYANAEKGYNIRYWSIGNEPNLFVALMGVPTYTVDDLNQQWRAIAEAMLAVDPDIRFIGPDITQYVVLDATEGQIEYLPPSLGGSALDANGEDWLQAFLRANGDLVDVVAVHRYPYPGLNSTGATIEGLQSINGEWDIAIPNLREIIRRAAGRDLPVAITEFNSNSANSSGGPASLDSFANAIWVGDVLARFIRHRVDYAAYWDVQGAGNRAWGLLGSFNVRPTAYTYMLYTHLGTQQVASESGVAGISVVAALREDGALTIMLVNLSPDPHTPTLEVAGLAAPAEAEVWRYDSEHKAAMLAPQTLASGQPVTLPAMSMTLYVIPAGALRP
jgi:hypothetical protein